MKGERNTSRSTPLKLIRNVDAAIVFAARKDPSALSSPWNNVTEY